MQKRHRKSTKILKTKEKRRNSEETGDGYFEQRLKIEKLVTILKSEKRYGNSCKELNEKQNPERIKA